MIPGKPSRGEIWYVDLDPGRGHEQTGRRPCLVVSVDSFNHGPAGLHVVLPMTTREKGIPFHIEAPSEETGLQQRGFIKCDDVRSVSRERFLKRLGGISATTMDAVEYRLRILMGL